MHGGFHWSNMKGGVASGVNPRRFRVTCELFSVRTRRGFLKSQVVSKRVPFQRELDHQRKVEGIDD
jgi:hypothetical protein